LLDERVGEKVNALSVESIENGLLKMLQNRKDYFSHEVVDFEQFRWDAISMKYKCIYDNI
jgi:hypothetical protein